MKFKRMAKIQDAISLELNKLGERELTHLIGECSRMTTTNCSWISYGLREIVTELAQAKIRWFKVRKSCRPQVEEHKK